MAWNYNVDKISTESLERMEEIYLSALRSSGFNACEMNAIRRYLSAVQSELRVRYAEPSVIDDLTRLWEHTQGQREVA